MTPTDISIIIPTCNRPAIVITTIEKACAAIQGIAAEIIVVNDGDAFEIPSHLLRQVQFYKNPKKGVSSARNFGVQKAKGNIFLFLDDDMWVNQPALLWIKNQFTDKQQSGCVYNLNWVFPPELEAVLGKNKIGQYLLRSLYNTMWGRMKEHGTEPAQGLYPFKLIMSGSFVISNELFEAIGGYNEQVIFQGEDRDLAERLNKRNIKIYCVFDVLLHHNQQDRLNIYEFLKRVNDGYSSEFRAKKEMLPPPGIANEYRPAGRLVFSFFKATKKLWVALHLILPSWKIVQPLNSRLIGALTGLQRYIAWNKVQNN